MTTIDTWPPWPVVYGHHGEPRDKNGDVIDQNTRPKAPEIFRLQGTGGLEFEVGDYGYVRIRISDGAVASFKVDNLDDLAAYISDLARRARLPN